MPKEDFVRLESKSGVPIWLLQMPYVKSVAMGMLVNVGARDEKPEEAGITHAVEHMVFEGTEEFPDSQSLDHYIESIGGDLDARTRNAMTFYYNSVPANGAECGFKVLSQMLRRPNFPIERIPIEIQRIIIQEICDRNDNPKEFVEDLFLEIAYGYHPLGKQILGSEESVSSFTQDMFRQYWRRFYHPANFTFVIVGKITPKEVVKLFNQYFPEPISQPANQRTLIFQTQPRTRELITAREIEQAYLVFGATTTKAIDRLFPALEVFQTMIDGGSSFPLFQEIRVKRGLCYEIRSTIFPRSDLGCFFIYCGADWRRKDEVIETAIQIIQKSKNSLELLERAKKTQIGEISILDDDIDRVLKDAYLDIHCYGKLKTYQEKVQEIERVTIDEVEEAVDRYLSPEKLVKVMLLPKSKKGRS